MIKAILACDQAWGIGKSGDLPWPYNADDMNWFKKTTDGNAVVMGKATWDSLPRKPLPNRQNIIVSRMKILGKVDTLSIDEALSKLPHMKKDVWIIGGARLIDGLWDIIDELHLSRIEGTYNCDTFLPENKILNDFKLSEVHDSTLYIETWTKK
ncbi:dihydrofolate reductase [bacterium]|nr:dihydrofolate reductase [bacterium]MDB4128694.1 dihydrofolate reductase [bacterium]